MSSSQQTKKFKAIYYHTNWACYGRNYQVSDIPIKYISGIAYAFVKVASNGIVSLTDTWADTDKRYTQDGVKPLDSWNDNPPAPFYGNLRQLAKLKAQGHNFDMQLAVGGWTLSSTFSEAVKPENRGTFVKSLCDMMMKYRTLDGKYTLFNTIAIDWEYLSEDGVNYGNGGNLVSKDDVKNYIAFLTQLKAALKPLRPPTQTPIRIAQCFSADPKKNSFDIKRVCEMLDQVHLMTYDHSSGAWGETVCAPHTNLHAASYTPFSAEEAVEFFLKKGVVASKLFIGVAFYSRGFANTTGLGKSAKGNSPDKSWEDGVVDYKQLPLPGAVEKFDPVTKSGYSIDEKRGVVNTYDTVESTKAKCAYVKAKGLGGVLIWSIDGDHPVTSSRSLVKCIYDELLK